MQFRHILYCIVLSQQSAKKFAHNSISARGFGRMCKNLPNYQNVKNWKYDTYWLTLVYKRKTNVGPVCIHIQSINCIGYQYTKGYNSNTSTRQNLPLHVWVYNVRIVQYWPLDLLVQESTFCCVDICVDSTYCIVNVNTRTNTNTKRHFLQSIVCRMLACKIEIRLPWDHACAIVHQRWDDIACYFHEYFFFVRKLEDYTISPKKIK